MAVQKRMSMSKDMKQDKAMMKPMNTKQKAQFKAADKKMDARKPSTSADMKMDYSLRNKILKPKAKNAPRIMMDKSKGGATAQRRTKLKGTPL